jgi:hypothetical protein
VLRPVHDPGLPENRRFAVQVQELADAPVSEALVAWRRVYEGLSDEDRVEVEEIALDRSRFARYRPE